MAKKGLLTKEEYQSLGRCGREIYSYWSSEKRKMCKSLAEEGKLYEIIRKWGESLDRMVEEQMENGLYESEAMEIARAQIYELD